MIRDGNVKDGRSIVVTSQYLSISIITNFYVSAVTTVCLSYIRDPKQYHKEDILNYLTVLVPDEIY